MEPRANSRANRANHKSRSIPGLWLTFYDTALRFVTLRQQIRGGTGRRPCLFLPGSRIGAICILTILSGSGTAPLCSQIWMRSHHCPQLANLSAVDLPFSPGNSSGRAGRSVFSFSRPASSCQGCRQRDRRWSWPISKAAAVTPPRLLACPPADPPTRHLPLREDRSWSASRSPLARRTRETQFHLAA